jgi:hypothetical protein
MRDPAIDPDGATSSRLSTMLVLPSCLSEQRATSSGNGGRDHSGMVGDVERNQQLTGSGVACREPRRKLLRRRRSLRRVGEGNCMYPAMPKRTLISIVEDDQPFRETTRSSRACWAMVETFPSVASFLASPLLAATACLVADIHMPGMTGVELRDFGSRRFSSPHTQMKLSGAAL